jgi:anti-anti-sigma factor
MALTVTVETPAEGVTVLRLSGRIDAAAMADFEAILMPHAENPAMVRIVLEGSGMEYIASAGMRVLLKAVKAMTPRKAKLCGAGMGASVTSVLKMTGFHSFIDLRNTVAECLA